MSEKKLNRRSTIKMSQEEANLIDEWICILLYTNNNEPIKGKVRFIKEIFFFSFNYHRELFDAAEFYPYYFGPYSTRIAYRVNILKNKGIITPFYKNQDWNYTLSKEGIQKAMEYFNNVKAEYIEAIKNIKNENRSRSLKQLLKEIYLNYPEYGKRSLIARGAIE